MATSARRQASTTSLAKFARANSPDLSNRSLEFCNTFWGHNDAGVDVLFARMRGAARTTEELRAFWKERASIEEEYGKRLSKLAKMNVGRDEIGELRATLDTLRLETDKQSGYHLQLSQVIKTDLDSTIASFIGRQAHHRKTFQSVVEKNWKAKQNQELHVNKAREKYETDCMRINAFTAQATLMQGRELEKIQRNLERTQQTVEANKRDFANFARALNDTVHQWEVDWKAFADSCQDLEDDRMEFLKDHMWLFANAVSTVCVSDDESCEMLRLALESFEPDRDQENFIRDYGTGNQIPDPPGFVDYNAPDAVPSSSAQRTARPAQFSRSSQRQRNGATPGAAPAPPAPAPGTAELEQVDPSGNRAGVGAAGAQSVSSPSQGPRSGEGLNRAPTLSRPGPRPDPGVAPNGMSGMNQQQQIMAPPGQSYRPDPNAEPIDPRSTTMLKVGNNAYEVDPSRDPQQIQSAMRPGVSPVQNGRPNVGDESDPLAQQMAQLRSGSTNSGSVRRTSTYGQPKQAISPGPSGTSSSSALVSPRDPNSANRDQWRKSAEFVVGAYPVAQSSGPTSPPTAVFMSPPAQSPSAVPVEEVVRGYEQSFPGERRSHSRTNSRRSSFVGGHSPRPSQSSQQFQNVNSNPGHQSSSSISRGRPVSRDGHAGIGANGRSTSPAPPFQNASRATSPAMQQQTTGGHRQSYMAPPPGGYGSSQQRAVSPNSVGIALDPSGKVAVDTMASSYQQQQQQQRPPPQQQQPGYPPPQAGPGPQRQPSINYQAQRQPSYSQPPQAPMYQPPPPPQQQPPPPPQPMQQPRQHTGYGGPPPQQPQQPVYQPAPPQPQQPQYQPSAQQPMYQPQQYGGPNGMQQPGGQLARGPSVSYGAPPPQQQPQQPHHYSQASQYSTHSNYGQPQQRAPSPQMPVMRAPSPQPPAQQGPPPTGQYTEDGKPVLFYVKALYDYHATIEEEFDFQTNDIIAVTATPEDGWWSGELLDEQRRVPGRHVFPSNFVTLF